MKGYMCIGLFMVSVVAAMWFGGVPVDAKETTTLDEAVNRPLKIERYVDKENGVVCYWNTRHPAYLTCVKVTRLAR